MILNLGRRMGAQGGVHILGKRADQDCNLHQILRGSGSQVQIGKRQPSPSHVGCRYQLTVGKARLGSRMVDALRYSRFLLFFSFFGNIQTLNDFIQRSSFFCKGQGPRPVDWQLFQEVRDTQAVDRFPLFLGLVPVAGGSSLVSGATSMG